MRYFLFRNYTIEYFFQHLEVSFSGYSDVSVIDENADRYIWCYFFPLKADSHARAIEIASYKNFLQMIMRRLPVGKMLLVFTMKDIFPIETISTDRVVADVISDYNAYLYALASQQENIKVVDFSGFMNTYSLKELIDWKYYFLSQMVLNPRLASDFKEWFASQINAIELRRKKCLVVDLDNTLWGGILGEDNVEGVALGGDYPGKAYLMFQQQILSLSREGVILAICSKNNREDVWKMWAEHPDIVLKEEHFSSIHINWNNKADNICEIARELNIGLDSLVFIDDNPAERELIKRYAPEVIVPDFPEQPYLLPLFFKEVAERYFKIYSLTEEDKVKTEQYKANAQRVNAQQSYTSMEEYIRSLEIELKITEVNDITLSRVAQMTQKTNQFNLTTHRYTDADIRQMLYKGNIIYTLSVSDKFGDSGITGLCIIEIEDSKARIDSLLLSCRILGKDIEKAFVCYVLQELKEKGFTEVTAFYVPTAKNMQVAEFYANMDFELEKEDKGGSKYYKTDFFKKEIILPDNYKYMRI
jgi:FkbH-like protein